MRVFVAGATGVIGVRLVPLLVKDGHTVAGMTRTATKVDAIRSLGAEPVVCDVFDTTALEAAITGFRPDVMVHQLTDLPDDPSRIREYGSANNRVRREGTSNLLSAAQRAGVSRFVAQSVAWPLPGDGGAAVDYLERSVLAAGGVVVRYGQFYGPGTYFPDSLPPPPRVQIDEAARRTIGALQSPTGVIIVTDSGARST